MSLYQRIMRSGVWRSVIRTPLPVRTNLDRSLAIFDSVFLHILPVKSRARAIRATYTYYLGAVSFFLFVILVVTGILLMLYYRPAVPDAYRDMKDLRYVVTAGMFLRNLHRWAAHAMVLAVFVHLLRVFYAGAYKPPREFNWVVGVGLFLATLLLSYTGYLLPYDQLAYWAVTVGTNIAAYMPVFGQKLRYLLLGGSGIGPNTLVRFYVLHCVILPVALSLLVVVHFWRIRKDGGLK
jgi:quinol-cytochrome oxidoreductase complex cytochrome b subunit